MCYSAGYLSKEIFRTLSSQYSSHRNLYCCIFTVATAQASSAIPNVCCIHPSAVLTSTGQDPGSSLLSLLYTFILYLGTIVSSLYPNFLRQALSLTIASHAGYSPLPPSASTQVSNISTQCNWPHLALLLPPAPASLSSSVLYPSTQYQRPSPPPPHSGCCRCSVLFDPNTSSPALTETPDGSPPTSHTCPPELPMESPERLHLAILGSLVHTEKKEAAPAWLPTTFSAQTVHPLLKLQPFISDRLLICCKLHSTSKEGAFRDGEGGEGERDTHTHIDQIMTFS